MRTLRNFFLTAVALCSATAAWAQTTFENEAGTLKFTVTDGTNVSVAKGTNEPSGAIDIPSEATDPESGTTYTVTSIGWSAFSNCTGLTSISIPEGVISIDTYAFENCSNLPSIEIPESVTSIGYDAFGYCSSLTSVTFLGSSHLETINRTAFFGCSNLSSITIPESVTSIGDDAFRSCISLTSINIPKLVTDIWYNSVFDDCGNLAAINVAEENEVYSSVDGVVFSKDQKTLQICPMGKTGNYTIPDGVTSIRLRAFENCRNLTTISIPESVASIGNGAFSGCVNLTSINVAEGNENYCSIDDVLFSKDQKTLMLCPTKKEGSYTILDEVTNIQSEAFMECSGITSITVSGTSKLETIGEKAFYNCTGMTSITIPDGVKSIGDYAFYRCIKLTSIIIPGSVTSIGSNAFESCMGLKLVTISDGVESIANKAFSYPYSHSMVIVIPKSVTSIGTSAFYNVGLIINNSDVTNGSPWGAKAVGVADGDFIYSDTGKSILYAYTGNGGDVEIPETVTTISSSVFNGCSNLTSVSFSGTSRLETIGVRAFFGCNNLTSIVIPESVTSIGDYAFKDCSSLTSVVTIPKSVTKIGNGAFQNCSSIETINYNAENCTTVGNYNYRAFSGCTSIETITIGENVTKIPVYAFSGCSGLKTLTIPASVTTIGADAFKDCNSIETLTYNTSAVDFLFRGKISLKTVNIGNSVTSISDYAFDGCTGLTLINIPEGATSIGNFAFRGCTNLKSVTIPSSVTAIGSGQYNSFDGCTGIETLTYNTNAVTNQFAGKTSLKTINIGDAVTSISSGAFRGCSSLTSINIPEGVTTIPWGAFQNCTNLTTVVIPNSVTSIGSDVFYGCKNLKSITLPFVGDKRHAEGDKWQWPIGYIFCDENNYYEGFDGGRKLFQLFVCDNPSGTNGRNFYIPRSLEDVTITDCDHIQRGAFYNCANLKSVTISSDVTSVDAQAFYGCSTMEKIVFECETPPDFGVQVFRESNNCPIYVPTEEAVTAYRAKENMGDYYSRIMVNPYCKVTVVANNDDYGTVSGSGTYNRTTTPTVTITATAAEHCSFICWAEDGATEATREITLSGAATYTAIFKRTVTISNVVAENKEYNGNAEAAISYDAEGLLDGDDVTVTPTAAFADANAGQGKVVSYSFELSGNDADNYVFANGSQSGTTTADITPILVSEPEIVLSATEFTYNGEAQTPTVTVKNGETVIAAAEYDVSFSDDVTNVGEKTVTVSNIAGNYTVNGSATYTINLAAEAPNKPEATMETRYINTEFIELPENWQWAENVALELGDNTATAEYAGADAGNYLIESVDVTINRLACEHTEGVDILNALEPTCTAEGYTGDQRCKICGEIIATGEAITAAGHKADSVVFENVVAATRTAAGSYDSVVYCSVCRVELSRTTVKVPQIVAESIKLASKPNKVEYKQGEALDVKGGKITIGYSDQSTDDYEILPNWVSGFNSEKVGKQTLTVTFEAVSSTLTTTFDVNVSAKDDDNTAVDEDAASMVNIYAYQNVIVVENATEEISIYNAMGALVCKDAARHVSTADGLGARTEIRMNNAGVYIVKVGNVAKRVFINR